MNSQIAHAWFRLPLPWLARLSGNGRGTTDRRAFPSDTTAIDASTPIELQSRATLEGGLGRILSEETFRWLLANERARAGRSGRPLRMLLVSLETGLQPPVRIRPAVAARLFTALCAAARDTDVIGWYREGRVAGVVLTGGCNGQGPEACARIMQRVGRALCERLPSRVAGQLRLQAVRVHPRRATRPALRRVEALSESRRLHAL